VSPLAGNWWLRVATSTSGGNLSGIADSDILLFDKLGGCDRSFGFIESLPTYSQGLFRAEH